MGHTSMTPKTNIQFGSTEYADTIPARSDSSPDLACATVGTGPDLARMASGATPPYVAPSPGPVYLEGRLVLSLSFQGERPVLDAIEEDEMVLESYRLWDDLIESWHEDDLAVLRFEHADVVMRLEPAPAAIWIGKLDTRARVILVPDLDQKGFCTNQAHDLCWKRT